MTGHRLTQTLRWQGRTVAWDRFGSGPALVFLHGTPWSSALWRPIADALSAQFTVYLWDMPGYGASSKESQHAVDLGVQGELFAHLLREWGAGQPHVIAHDFGGAVALRARLLHEARYRSLCLVDVVALSPWGSPFFTLVKQNADVFAQLPQLCTAALSRPTSKAPVTEDCATTTSRCLSTHGPARTVNQRSTGRSRRPTSATPTRLSHIMQRSPNRPTSSGVPMTSGSLSTVLTVYKRSSRTQH